MIRVLLVDDDPALFNVTKLLLEREGQIEVHLCESADIASEMMRNDHFQVIVSDYEMPGENGIHLLKRLRSAGDATPFILFTGRGSEEVAMEACNAGADFYLTKAGPPQQVFRVLREFVFQAAERGRDAGRPGKQRGSAGPLDGRELVLILDSDLTILYTNGPGAGLLGFPASSLPRGPILPYLAPSSRLLLADALVKLTQPPGMQAGREPGCEIVELTFVPGPFTEPSRCSFVLEALSGPGSRDPCFLAIGWQDRVHPR